MKLTKECSECGGREIYTFRSAIGGQTGNLLPGVLGSFWTGAKIDVYVCGGCGYHQIFATEETLEEIKEKWQRHV